MSRRSISKRPVRSHLTRALRSLRVPPHPGFTLSAAVVKQMQSTTTTLRQMVRAWHAGSLTDELATRSIREALSAVEAVLDAHISAKPAQSGEPARRRIRLSPKAISAFAEVRYQLTSAYVHGARQDEKNWSWLHWRAWNIGEGTRHLLAAVLRGHRSARAFAPEPGQELAEVSYETVDAINAAFAPRGEVVVLSSL